MQHSKSISDRTLDELLRAFPGAARNLARLGLACAGCPMAPFETPRDAAKAYHISQRTIVGAIRRGSTTKRSTP